MNRPFRVSILGVMGLVAVASVGAMGLCEGTALWASLTFGMVVLSLLGATLNAILQSARNRAGWVGFALFGWVYLALNFGPWADLELPPRPESWLVEWLLYRVHPEPEYEPIQWVKGEGAWVKDEGALPSSRLINPMQDHREQLKPGSIVWPGDRDNFRQSAHALGALAFALIGAAWAVWLSRRIARSATANSRNST